MTSVVFFGGVVSQTLSHIHHRITSFSYGVLVKNTVNLSYKEVDALANFELKTISAAFGKYKYLLLVAAVGVVLLLWPPGEDSPQAEKAPDGSALSFELDLFERKLEKSISAMQGAGRVEVMITLKSDGALTLQEDRRENQARNSQNGDSIHYESDTDSRTVVISGSGGVEQPVVVGRVYPEFQGALVVCDGAGSAEVRLQIAEAVAALTGLGADRITVAKMKQQ